MSFEKAVEAAIREAMQRGEFDNLPGAGKPIDLSAYFETPEEVRLAYSVLKQAGIQPREVDLLQEIAELKQILAAVTEEGKKAELQRQLQAKQVEFSLRLERSRGRGRRKG